MRYFVFAAILAVCAFSLSFRIDPNREECFYEDITAGTHAYGAFSVLQGGLLDLDVRVYQPDGGVVWSADRRHEGEFSFAAQMTGAYKFCFLNHMSKMTPKLVRFVLHVGDDASAPGVAKKEHLTPLENSVVTLREGLRAIHEEQEYFKAREARHRNTTESTNARVLWFSFLEALVLILVSLWQIFYLRKLFDRRPSV